MQFVWSQGWIHNKGGLFSWSALRQSVRFLLLLYALAFSGKIFRIECFHLDFKASQDEWEKYITSFKSLFSLFFKCTSTSVDQHAPPTTVKCCQEFYASGGGRVFIFKTCSICGVCRSLQGVSFCTNMRKVKPIIEKRFHLEDILHEKPYLATLIKQLLCLLLYRINVSHFTHKTELWVWLQNLIWMI